MSDNCHSKKELAQAKALEEDAYIRFKAMAETGNPEEGLKILDLLDTLTK